MCCHSYMYLPPKTKDEKEEEAKRICAQLPLCPCDEILSDFARLPYDKIRAVFRSESVTDPDTGKKVRKVGVRCGFCGTKAFYPYYQPSGGSSSDSYALSDSKEIKATGATLRCPSCLRDSELVSYARGRNRAIGAQGRYAIQVENVLGHIVIIHWSLDKWLDRDGKETTSVKLRNASYQVGKRMFRAVGYSNYYGNRYPCDRWSLNTNFSPSIPGLSELSVYWRDEKLTGTEEYNDGLKKYLNAVCSDHPRTLWLERYLMIWTKHPNFENIVKTAPIEYTDALLSQDIMWGHSINTYVQRLINFKKTRPHEMLGLEKEDMKRLFGKRFAPSKLAVCKSVGKRGLAGIENLLERASDSRVNGFMRIMESNEAAALSPPYQKTLRYWLDRNTTQLFSPEYLCDYWRMTRETEETVSPEVMFPKDLRAAHERAAGKYSAAKNKETDKKIAAVASKLKAFEFSDEETGLFIRPAMSVAELTLEGQILHH